MAIERDETLEISQVGNGFIVRRASGNWFADDSDTRSWTGERADYLVFRTMAEMQAWLAQHFTWRAVVDRNDAVSRMPEIPKAKKVA